MGPIKQKFKIAILLSLLLAGFQNCAVEHKDGEALVAPSLGPTGLTQSEFLALQVKALKILDNRCSTCHYSGGDGNGSLPDAASLPSLLGQNCHDVNNTMVDCIIEGQPQNSPLYLELLSGNEPQGGPNMVTTAQYDLITLRDWIAAMSAGN
jgi:hypothetical protein